MAVRLSPEISFVFAKPLARYVNLALCSNTSILSKADSKVLPVVNAPWFSRSKAQLLFA